MKNNILPFMFGLILTTVVLFGVVWFATKGENPEPLKPQAVISSDDMQKVNSNSADLKNYGNLPVTVNPGDFGRTNPFESY